MRDLRTKDRGCRNILDRTRYHLPRGAGAQHAQLTWHVICFLHFVTHIENPRMLLYDKILPLSIFRSPENEDGSKHCVPEYTYRLAGLLIPWFAMPALVFSAAGLYLALFAAPGNTPVGEVYRIAFIHVPASWMSMFIYLAMTLAAGAGRPFNASVAAMTARALAPTGAMFTFLGIWSGCLWGKAISGTWWAEDVELYSELMLMLFYGGVIALHVAIDDLRRANRACVPMAFAGLVCVPINLASLQSWSVEHAETTLGFAEAPGQAIISVAGMLAMSLGFLAYAGSITLLRLRCMILEDERQSDWVARYEGKSL